MPPVNSQGSKAQGSKAQGSKAYKTRDFKMPFTKSSTAGDVELGNFLLQKSLSLDWVDVNGVLRLGNLSHRCMINSSPVGSPGSL